MIVCIYMRVLIKKEFRKFSKNWNMTDFELNKDITEYDGFKS